MRKTAMALNVIVATFFIGFLTYTFIARSHLDSQARRFVTEKTVQHSKPVVELAEKAMEAPIVRQLLVPAHEAAVRREIDQYRQDPAAYVADLTRQAKVALKPAKLNPLLAKVAAIKDCKSGNSTTTR